MKGQQKWRNWRRAVCACGSGCGCCVSFVRFAHSACFLSISSISTAHFELSDWSVLRGLFQGNFRRIWSVSTASFCCVVIGSFRACFCPISASISSISPRNTPVVCFYVSEQFCRLDFYVVDPGGVCQPPAAGCRL
jgi:hypothetical protein